MTTSTSHLSDTMRYLTVCGKGWLVIYLTWVLISSALTSLTLHLMVIGLFICVVAALKLPSPDKDLVRKVLGEDIKIDDQENSGQDIIQIALLFRAERVHFQICGH